MPALCSGGPAAVKAFCSVVFGASETGHPGKVDPVLGEGKPRRGNRDCNGDRKWAQRLGAAGRNETESWKGGDSERMGESGEAGGDWASRILPSPHAGRRTGAGCRGAPGTSKTLGRKRRGGRAHRARNPHAEPLPSVAPAPGPWTSTAPPPPRWTAW